MSSYNEALANDTLARLEQPRTTSLYPAFPIREKPFYALPVCCGIEDTRGGIAIDAGGRALRPDGSAIAGLYAAGSTVSGIEGGPNVAYMGGLSKAYIFGLLAAEAIAAAAGKQAPGS